MPFPWIRQENVIRHVFYFLKTVVLCELKKCSFIKLTHHVVPFHHTHTLIVIVPARRHRNISSCLKLFVGVIGVFDQAQAL